MEMFLTLVVLSLLGTFVTAALFVAAARMSATPPEEDPTAPQLPAPRFFAAPPHAPTPQIPIEVLLLQIERHVRLEEAAAESFVRLPTRELLHSRTASPLVH